MNKAVYIYGDASISLLELWCLLLLSDEDSEERWEQDSIIIAISTNSTPYIKSTSIETELRFPLCPPHLLSLEILIQDRSVQCPGSGRDWPECWEAPARKTLPINHL